MVKIVLFFFQYRLISERTVEENILKKANQKRMLGDMAIEGGNFTTTFFKEQTISELFSEPSGLDSLVKEKENEEREKQKRAEEQKEQIKEEEEKVDTKAVVQFEKVSGQEAICSHKFHKLNKFKFSKTFVKRPLSKRPIIGFQDELSLNVGQKYCRMLRGEHYAILSTFI